MGKISIFVILMIFTIHNIVGDDGDWETVPTDDDNNSLYFSLIYILIDDNTYDIETDYVAQMRKQLTDELRARQQEYQTDPRLQQMTIEQCINNLNEQVPFEGAMREFELDLISKVFKSEIVVCDWTIKNIRIYRKGDDITRRFFLLYTSENHYDPLYKNYFGTEITTFAIGDEADRTRYNDALTVAQDPKYFVKLEAGTSEEKPSKRQRK